MWWWWLCCLERVGSDLVEEEIVFLLTEDFQQGGSHLVLMARVAGDEVLHICVAAGGGL